MLLCSCCAIAAANDDVSGCEDGLGHVSHALSAATGYVVIDGTEPTVQGGYWECDGCQWTLCAGESWSACYLDALPNGGFAVRREA